MSIFGKEIFFFSKSFFPKTNARILPLKWRKEHKQQEQNIRNLHAKVLNGTHTKMYF